MKTLISTLFVGLFAGLFALGVASAAYAGGISTDFHSLNALDSSGVAVVAVQSPSMPLAVSSGEKIYLDSNKIWAVNEVHTIPFSQAVIGQKGMEKSMLYCFDSGSKFCARAY